MKAMERTGIREFAFVPAMFLVVIVLLAPLLAPLTIAAQHPAKTPSEHSAHDGMNMTNGAAMGSGAADAALDAATAARQKAKIAADKKESEFNHHLAGFFVVAAGLFVLAQPKLTRRWPAARYIWPSCFLLAGIFVLVWSDTELWPFGPRAWSEALQNNREVLQHKTFAVLLLGLGTIEWLRASGRLRAVWSSWVFPVVAILGSAILVFHEHEGGMSGENHMEVMARIQWQHMSYTLSGLGIGLSKGLSELKVSISGVLARVWPLLMIVLGVLLLFYQE